MSMRRVSVFLGVIATVSACGGASTPADGSAEASSGGSSADGSTGTTGMTGGMTSATTADDATASADGSSSGGMTSSNDDAPPPVGFDLGGLPDVPEVACSANGKGGGGGIGAAELSYIWIANTYQQPNPTISKIDTVTMLEEGRYQAKPAGGDPSRTSVNLDGDVAVANRNGGVAKFYARESSCEESNGQPGIQTSTGSNDVLAWGEEECLAWYLPLACSSNRPLAWTRGEFSELTCAWENEKLWTVCDSEVLLLNGDTGEVEETILVPGSAFVYGGAADADGNFWGLNTGSGSIFRVDFESLELLSWPLGPNSGYGITVDPEGRPWTCGGGGASRFNIDDATWTVAGSSGIGGCMTDGVSTLWHSTGNGLLNGYDIESLEIVNTIQLPEYVHGISVDFQGNVWGVGFTTNNAHRADPMTGQVDTYSGLTSAYTYSDMTGLALNTAGGGGVPPN
jgi:hypothetical protein